MEPRAQRIHRERLADAMREEISAIVEGELADPRIGLASVTDVQIIPGAKTAMVMINVPDAAEEKSALAGLEAAKGFIQHVLVERLRLRHAPELHFRLDRSLQFETKIDTVLERVNKRKK
jgi:ribosome-binding factor A